MRLIDADKLLTEFKERAERRRTLGRIAADSNIIIGPKEGI